jgi:hypothetical protein
MTSRRRNFPAAVKLAAFRRCQGRREGDCGGARLYVGKFEYHHRIPDGLDGEPTLENCVVLCIACHDAVTYREDIPRIAKTKRAQRKHLGIHSPGRSLPCGRASGVSKKITGEVVPRRSQSEKHRDTMEGRVVR